VEGAPYSLMPPKALPGMTWLGPAGTAFAYRLFRHLIAWRGAGRSTMVTYTFLVVMVALGVVANRG